MRTSLALPFASLLTSFPCLAQVNPAIDLNLWTVEHVNGAGPWTIDASRFHCNSTNAAITDCSTFYSDFDVTLLEFRMSIDPSGGDDDLPGFILGWQPGDSTNPTADYVLVDWKKVTQNFQNWGTAVAGLAISHVVGPFTRGYGGGPIDLWSHTGVCTELARGTNSGSTGWDFDTDYFFRVLYTPASVDVWLNGNLEFQVTGTFNPGRFACYNYSQSMTRFQFPVQGAVQQFGNGCPGSAGTPYMFSPATPYVGMRLPMIVANLPASAPAFLVLGGSNAVWGSAPLPFGLTALGAPGCSAYVSADVFVPATNYNGTAYLELSLPATLLPSSVPRFFTQGMALDPAANALGVVLSNAVSIAVGIR